MARRLGQAELRVTDSSPCQNANYQLFALADVSGSAAGTGQISTAYRVGATGPLQPFRIPVGTRLTYKVTAYNDVGRTALGVDAGPGFCAVDARIIPWVPGSSYRAMGSVTPPTSGAGSRATSSTYGFREHRPTGRAFSNASWKSDENPVNQPPS